MSACFPALRHNYVHSALDRPASISRGVMRKRLGQQQACIVDQDVDPAKPRDSGVCDFLACCAITYIAIHECQVRRGN